MKTQLAVILSFMAGMAVMLAAGNSDRQTFDKISVKEFELTDDKGMQRASIKVEEGGEVVFRLKDANGTIRVKLGASEGGSGLVLLDDSTNPRFHALAKKNGPTLTLTNQDGQPTEY